MRSTAMILFFCLLLGALTVSGQTADLDSLRTALCVRDSLYLVSPDNMEFQLSEGQYGSLRFGLLVGWDNPGLDDASCFALRGVDSLDVAVEAEGGFGDKVDRVLRFTISGSGTVGADQPGQLLLGWRNEGPSTYGNMAGFINLANNGGAAVWDAAGLQWNRANTALPMSWRQANFMDLAMTRDGTMWASLTAGQTADTAPQGLFRNSGAGWSAVADSLFGTTRLVTVVAAEPDSVDRIVVGTLRDGFFISTDGGSSFTQWSSQLGAGMENPPETFRVTAVDWTGSRVLVAVRAVGLFISNNNGVDFVDTGLRVPDDLDKTSPTMVLPEANQLLTDPADSDHILVSLRFHGCYESIDGGVNWHDLYGDLLVPDPLDNGAWVRSALSVGIDPSDGQTLVMAAEQWGLYRTTNGGLNWNLVAEEVQPESVGQLRRIEILADPSTPGRMYAMEDGWSLISSDDAGATWTHFDPQPTLNTSLAMAMRPGGDGGSFVVGTWNGGLYETGSAIAISETYSTETSPELRDLDLGLFLRFNSGTMDDHADDPALPADAFELVGQTYQGWAVWRSTDDAPDDMILVGKFDRVNPEACIAGFCGDLNFQPLPQCYHSTRAACFGQDEDGKIWFFDSEVYNAFRYNYAVTAFDYANTAEITPQNLPRDMIISPRWNGDTRSIFSGAPYNGAGNRTKHAVDRTTEPVAGGEGVYVFPNPLRNDAGIPGEEGRTVVFTNLPDGARVRIFTTAGDDVINLGSDNMSGGQIRWKSENRNGESVAAGVYLYKVEVEGRDDLWGRLVIIR
ncbi:hypothetical protein DRQ50_01395 [bacterium]|nr:MAG: hypothetical protein DRQ50_01395 [bacterium]